MRWILPFLACLPCLATDIIPSDWKLDWTSSSIRYSGNRSTNDWPVYTNLPSSTTVSGINSAIANCPVGQMVRLSNGTFTVDAQITVSRSNIRIQGAGPTETILQVTASSGRVISVGAGDFPITTVRTWTGGFTKGTSTITVDSASGISVGNLIVLTQSSGSPASDLVNPAGDEGNCDECAGALENQTTNTFQHQTRVTSVSGLNIGIEYPLHSTNWNSAAQPRVYVESVPIRTNVVFDGFQIDNSASSFGQFHFRFGNAADILVQNVWSKRASNRHLTTLHCARIEMRDCYLQDSKDWSTHSYGFAPYNCTGFVCENNIFQGVTGAFKPTAASYGVFAYNYVTNVLYYNPPPTGSPGWLQATIGNHGSHVYGVMIEGNIAPSANMDNVHGSGSHNVLFRNRFSGHETNRTDNSRAIMAQATNRCLVIAGNILGKTNFHTQALATYNDSGVNDALKVVECYGYQDTSYSTTDGDTPTVTSMIRTHNQVSQTLNGGTNGGVYWRNGYDGSLVLEPSYIFTEKPQWWGCSNWPSIGPDLLSLCTNDVIVFNPAKYRYESGNYFTNLIDNCRSAITGPGRQLGRKSRVTPR